MQKWLLTKFIVIQPQFHMVNKLAEDRSDANYADGSRDGKKLMLLGASSRWIEQQASEFEASMRHSEDGRAILCWTNASNEARSISYISAMPVVRSFQRSNRVA